MWSEPLVPVSEIDARDPRRYRVLVFDAHGIAVAALEVLTSPRGRVATCDELTIVDNRGTPKQRARALVLLCREAFRAAADLGQTAIHCEVPDRLLAFVERLTGRTGRHLRPGWRIFAGDLADFRSAVLERTDADGNL